MNSYGLIKKTDTVVRLYLTVAHCCLTKIRIRTSNSVACSLLRTSFRQGCSVKLPVNSYNNKSQAHIFLPNNFILHNALGTYSNFVSLVPEKVIEFNFYTGTCIHDIDLFELSLMGLYTCIIVILTVLTSFNCKE